MAQTTCLASFGLVFIVVIWIMKIDLTSVGSFSSSLPSLCLLKRRTDADAEYTEDGQDERIGATEYAEGNGTRKRGGKAECIT